MFEDSQNLNPEPIDVDELLMPMQPVRALVWDKKIDALPLHDHLTPENFEKLVFRIAANNRRSGVQAHRYGGQGHFQGGIDVIVIDPAAKRAEVYEAKRVANISSGQITHWVNKFLAGPHATRARKYVLCTTYPVHKFPKLIEEWNEAAECLVDHNVEEVELMDDSHIQEWLKGRHRDVYDMFGEEAAKRFCTNALNLSAPPEENRFRSRYVGEWERFATIENDSVRCELMMPELDAPHTGAILSFARQDLRGVVVQLTSSEIVGWCQWRAHADNDAERPYAVRFPVADIHFIFTANAARFRLEENEVKDLDWVLCEGWKRLVEKVGVVLNHWRCLPFKRIKSTLSTPIYSLASVPPWFWEATLAFANAHLAREGDSEWHIFEESRCQLKVYSSRTTAHLDAGYHAILWAYNQSSLWSVRGANILIGWSRIELLTGQADALDPRRQWDASYTHDWLFGQLFPEVLRWLEKNETQRSTSVVEKLGLRRRSPYLPRLSDFAYSCADEAARCRVVPSENALELLNCVEALQTHFASRSTTAPHEPLLWNSILVATAQLARRAEHLDEAYIRSNIQLPRDIALVPALEAAANRPMQNVGSFAIELALRSLKAVLEVCKIPPRADLSYAASKIQCVLDRRYEDLICDHICQNVGY